MQAWESRSVRFRCRSRDAFLATIIVLAFFGSLAAQEPRAAQLNYATLQGADAVQQSASGDDWTMHSISTYKTQRDPHVFLWAKRAITQARPTPGLAVSEVPVDTDLDGQADAWVYFQGSVPRFVEMDSQGVGCHDIRVDVQPANLQANVGRVEAAVTWFVEPPLPLATKRPAFKFTDLFDWGIPAPAAMRSQPVYFRVAEQAFPQWKTAAADIVRKTQGDTTSRLLAGYVEQAQRLYPRFLQTHRHKNYAETLRFTGGFRIQYDAYNLDEREGLETVAAYSPAGVHSISFYEGDWQPEANASPFTKSPTFLAEVFFHGGGVVRIDLKSQRYFCWGEHLVRLSQTARKRIASNLLAPAWEAFLNGDWYACAASSRQAVQLAMLCGDISPTTSKTTKHQLTQASSLLWKFNVGDLPAERLLGFSMTVGYRRRPHLAGLARLYRQRREFKPAIDLLKRALVFARKTDDVVNLVNAYKDLASVYQQVGKYDRSIEYLQFSLDHEMTLQFANRFLQNIRQSGIQADDRKEFNRALQMRSREIAALQTDLGNFEQARARLAEAQRLADMERHGYLQADLQNIRAKLDMAEGRWDLAEQRLLRAMELTDKQLQAQANDDVGAEILKNGEAAYYFDILEDGARYRVAMRTPSHPLGYQALSASLLAELKLEQVGPATPEQRQELLKQAEYWQRKSLAWRKEIGDDEGALVGELRLATIAAFKNQRKEAMGQVNKVVQRARTMRMFEILWRALALQAALYEAAGDTIWAIDAYEQAAKEIESVRATIRSEPVRRSFFGSKIDVYERLAVLRLDLAPKENGAKREKIAQQVWRTMERAKARTLLDLVAGESLKTKGNAAAKWKAQQKLGANRAASDPLLTEVASLSVAQPADFQSVAKTLRSDECLIEYFILQNETLAAVIQDGRLQMVRLPNAGRNALRKMVAEARRRFEDPALPYREISRKLYDNLLAPCLAAAPGAKRLIIVPGGALHYLPFSALVSNDGRFVAEQFPVSYAASASALVYATRKAEAAPHRRDGELNATLVVANPQAPPGFEPLPNAEKEGRFIAQAMPSSTLLIGKNATETAILKALATSSFFHFAGHTNLSTQSPLSTALLCTPDTENDGRIEVRELFELDLKDCRLAVLSACETRLGRWSRGDEVIGLERSFLRAGVPTVISSLWKVDDSATQAVMTRFYTNLKAGRKMLNALHEAQVAVLHSFDQSASYSSRGLGGARRFALPKPSGRNQKTHPFYWASFVLSGARRQ